MEAKMAIEYWMDMSDYDIKTAHAMFNAERFLYVGFMTHQAIEKALKAIHWKLIGTEPPYTHDLWRIAKSAGIDLESDEEKAELIDELQPLNIEARYPKDKEAILSSLSHDYCGNLIERTERMLKWIRTQL